jgi:hypothetical protein
MTASIARFLRMALSIFAAGCFIEFGLRVYPVVMRSFGSKLHQSDTLVEAEVWILFAMLAGAIVRVFGVGVAFRAVIPVPGKSRLAIALLGEMLFCISIIVTLGRIFTDKAIPIDPLTRVSNELAMAASLVGCMFFTRQIGVVFRSTGAALPSSKGLTMVMPVILICACLILAGLAFPPVANMIAASGNGEVGQSAKIATVIAFLAGMLFANWGRLVWLFLFGKWLWRYSKKAGQMGDEAS